MLFKGGLRSIVALLLDAEEILTEILDGIFTALKALDL